MKTAEAVFKKRCSDWTKRFLPEGKIAAVISPNLSCISGNFSDNICLRRKTDAGFTPKRRM